MVIDYADIEKNPAVIRKIRDELRSFCRRRTRQNPANTGSDCLSWLLALRMPH